MKKFLFITAMLVVTVTASAQFAFGVKGGLNIVNMSLDSEVLKSDNKTGWFIGPAVKFNIPVINLGLDAAVLYDQRSSDVTVNTDTLSSTNTMKRQAINIPINIRYGIGLGELGEVFVKAGPQFGFNVGDKGLSLLKYKDCDYKQEYKSSEFSINVGGGVMLLKHLEVAANYNIVCGKTGEVSAQGVAGDVLNDLKSTDTRTNAWQISATYYF